jgi:hypothetical protein
MKYRIIIEVTGDAPIVEAANAMDAEDAFVAEVTGDQLLQLLTIGAEEIKAPFGPPAATQALDFYSPTNRNKEREEREIIAALKRGLISQDQAVQLRKELE